jgi:hypothetical protein
VSERDDDPMFDEAGAVPPTDAERALDEALGEALRSAYDPAPIDPKRHAELLERLLVDPFAPPTAEEARESERLRQALEAGDESHADVRLLRALSHAREPARLSPEAGSKARAELARASRTRTTNVVFVSFGAAALAAAAGFALLMSGGVGSGPSARAERLAPSRSTAELFEHEFELGKTTERIDRIASARAHDLRENRYRIWGAR